MNSPMKNLLLLLVAPALLSGCSRSPDPRDQKIADLENQVSNLHADVLNLKTNLLEFADSTSTNLDAAISNQSMLQLSFDLRLLEAETMIQNLSNSIVLIEAGRVGAARTATTVQSASTRDGVPMDVYNQIAADAKLEWPSDFNMQEFVIKQQTTAWRNLHSQ